MTNLHTYIHAYIGVELRTSFFLKSVRNMRKVVSTSFNACSRPHIECVFFNRQQKEKKNTIIINYHYTIVYYKIFIYIIKSNAGISKIFNKNLNLYNPNRQPENGCICTGKRKFRNN